MQYSHYLADRNALNYASKLQSISEEKIAFNLQQKNINSQVFAAFLCLSHQISCLVSIIVFSFKTTRPYLTHSIRYWIDKTDTSSDVTSNVRLELSMLAA